MKQNPLKILLIDEGMNTGDPAASKIGGGQMARRRFFSDDTLFKVTVLSSEPEICRFWEGHATILYEPALQTYRPSRIHIAKQQVRWFNLVKDGLRAARILRRHVAGSKADLVFLNDNKSRLLYILGGVLDLKSCSGCRTAIEVDGEWKLGVFDAVMKFLYILMFDKIICPTRAVSRSLGWIGKRYSHKILVAYPGVEVPKTNEIRTGRTKNFEKPIIFGCVGTLRAAVKGQDIVIRAVSRLIKKNGAMPFKVCFFGDGPDKPMLEKLIRALGVDGYFEFKGYVNNQSEIYRQMDACIVASRTETASIVLMECLTRNIPVITADLEACKEILSRFYDDLFFKQGNEEDLALKMEYIMKKGILEKVQKQILNTDKRFITRDYQVKRVFEFLKS